MARSSGNSFFKLRIVIVHVIYIIYSTLLWLKLVEIGEKTGHPKNETQIALILWTVCFVGCHGVIAYSGFSERFVVNNIARVLSMTSKMNGSINCWRIYT